MAETGRKKRLPELGRRGFLSKSRDVKEGSPLKGPGGSPKRPNSPEPNCSICLGGIEDQSFANKCFHSFCRTCLFEWSKVKPECPVCRQGFDSIIFNVKAMDDYEEYNIPRPLSPRSLWSVGAYIAESGRWDTNSNFNILRHRVIHLQDMFSRNSRSGERETPGRPPRRLSFFYAIDQQSRDNSTNTGPTNSSSNISSTNTERTPPRAHESSRNSVFPFEIAAYFRNFEPGHQRTPAAGTFDHRRYIYEHDLWVQPIVGRLARECSASFYRNNPAVTHRLLPFLNRELVAILRTDTEPNHSAEALLSRIKAAIFEYDIPSIRFRQVIEPYTRDKTHHFLHELYYFAKSPYTIEDYNVHAIYVPKAHVKQLKLEQPISRPFAVFTHEHQEPETDSSTDDSVIEVVDSEQDEQSSRRNENRMQYLSASASTSTSTPRTTTTVIPSSPAPITTSRPPIETIESRKAVIRRVLKEFRNRLTSRVNQETPLTSTLSQNINVIEDFDNPRPGPSGLCRNNDFKTSSTKTKIDDDGSETEIDVGTNEKPMIKQNYDSDSDDSDDSIKVVGYKKPIRERTPEIINISSCGESGDNRSDYDSDDDNDEEPQKKRIKKNGESASKFLAKVSGHRCKSEIGKSRSPLINEDDKITDSEGSENEKERSIKKKQKKRRKTKSSHSKRRKDSSSSRHVEFDGTTPSDTTSSEDESPTKRGEIGPFKFLRRIPSVIVRPPTLRPNSGSLTVYPLSLSSSSGINSSGNGGSNTHNTSNNSSGGNNEMTSTSRAAGTSSNVIATLCSSLKRKFDESTDSESTDNDTTARFNDIIGSFV